MDDCVFCKIINKEIPANIVYESDKAMAFDDAFPVAKVHTLVVPKKHISNMMELKDEDMEYIAEIHKAIQEVARIKGVDETGFRVITNYGADGGQTVMHLHYHVIGGEHLGPKIR